MRHLADIVLDDNHEVIGNRALRALCGVTGTTVLPKGTPVSDDVCPECLRLAGA